ncbi:probable aspartic proteinase GIP2 [Rutidosis leptorrhynchoides]|uniref:probable aspartic proteinase GIP2 n=1 Tax=Rutidosis leptorrhynchoides TaxID=125765 RepID=UPI003A9A54B9
MHSFLQLIVTLLAFILFHEYEVVAVYVPPYSSLLVPITKHTDAAATPLYSVPFETSWDSTRSKPKNFLIDTDAPFTWNDCIVDWNNLDQPGICTDSVCTYPVSCEDDLCLDVRTISFKNPSCPLETNNSTLPGWGDCTCPVNVVNPITGSCIQGLLNYQDLMLRTSNGTNPIDSTYGVTPDGACVPSTLESFPANVTGVLALSTSPFAFQSFININNVMSIISLCLPSTTSDPGVLFFGKGPYYFQNVDIRSYLSYTPLLNHPDSFGYFIGVTSIVIKKRSNQVPTNATTKLSTIEPYTTLRTDIYNQVIRRFSMVTKRIQTVKPIAPFGLCYKSYTNSTEVGLKVPDIDFSLESGNKWSVSTANSMKQMTEDVACLAFVDGGATSEHGIVIGTFQYEDNFVSFDLKNSTFGFSSSLLRKQISCANFNFTTIASN